VRNDKKMMKTSEQNTKKLNTKALYLDALYFSLIHRGVREEIAEIQVARIARQKKTDPLDN